MGWIINIVQPTLLTNKIMALLQETEHSYDILKSVKNNAYAGMLHCLYSIRYHVGKELTDEQQQKAYMCLNVIAEDTNNSNEVRAWCYNQLGLMCAGMSTFIRTK